ncbi:MAG: methyltransferase domain-containing protein [Candidatus Gracilibacteria bacterium]
MQDWGKISEQNDHWNSNKAKKIQEKESQVIIKWLKDLNLLNYNILEVGCGNGYVGLKISDYFLKEGIKFEYYLTDLIPNCLEKAKENFADLTSRGSVKFGILDVYKIDKILGAQTQEIIISTGFASAATYKDAVPVVSRSLKKGGVLICDFINNFSPVLFLSNIPRSISRIINNKKYAKDVNSKYYHFGKIGIKEYFRKYDLELVDMKYIGVLKNPIVAIFKKRR